MLRYVKYRLYPTKQQEATLAKYFGCSRWVFNWGLAEKTRAWKTDKKNVTRYELDKQLTKLKRTSGTEWLAEANAQALQQSLARMEAAFARFFKEKKGYPRFKSKHSPQSLSFPQATKVSWEKATIAFPKLGPVRAVLSNRFTGAIRTVTLSRTATYKYFAFVLVDDGNLEPVPHAFTEETVVGVDVGIKHFATLSNGEKIVNPRPLKRNLSKLKREQRRLSRCKKGSNNRNKQRLKVARVYEKVANCRKDFLHKVSTRLIRENQAIAFETLNIAGMLRNHCLAQHIADAAWGTFFQFCRYKATWAGSTILTIGLYRPSSRESLCGWINTDLKLSDRVWTCPQCGRTYDRDVHAAQNIKRWALSGENIRRDTPELRLVEVGVSQPLKQESSAVVESVKKEP